MKEPAMPKVAASPLPAGERGDLRRARSFADRVIFSLAREGLPPVLTYTLTALSMLVAAALQRQLPVYHGPYLLLFPPIFISSMAFGLGEGLLSAVMATVLAAVFFMDRGPGHLLTASQTTTSILFLVFSSLLVAVCAAFRSAALRQSTELERYQILRAEAEASARALAASEEALLALNETLEVKVTERTAALEETQEALRQSQKMEALGQLTGGVAHDFNNLLAGVIGGLEMARARLEQGRQGEAPRYLDLAEDAARRGAALTRRLLSFSRRQALQLERLDLVPLVAGFQDLIGRTVGPGVCVDVRSPGDLWAAFADRSQLENALLNLAINARDAMDGRGCLSIDLANVSLSEAEAGHRALPPGEYVRLTVGDTGSGMTPEVAARAFDPFFTTKPAGTGTGLGLSMIYAFARQAGGGAWLETTPGLGTKVNLLLPRLAASADEPASAPARAASPDGEGKTILLVDDEPSLQTVLAEALGSAGYRVLVASDSADGLAHLRGDDGIQLVICDLGLPGAMNGRQLFEAARQARPDIRVLFITGFAADEADAMLDPEMPRLAKPFDLDTLNRAVADVLAP
ncbi:MAG TPA: ATP-binding protein [Caulobacteraceae bacterium]|nr:ATP-binding protein [Caulobacteraceae bacterium]